MSDEAKIAFKRAGIIGLLVVAAFFILKIFLVSIVLVIKAIFGLAVILGSGYLLYWIYTKIKALLK